MSPLWLLLIAWVFFYSFHSLLANSIFKDKLKLLIGDYFRFYRLIYNVLNIVMLSTILWYQFNIPKQYFLTTNIYTQGIGATIFIIGLVLLISAFSSFNKLEFAGFEQLTSNKQEIKRKTELITDNGMYAYVRHPLYFALILMFLGALVFQPTYAMLIFVGITFIYLPIGVKMEEQKLIGEFGKDYIKYRKKVKMLIPFIY